MPEFFLELFSEEIPARMQRDAAFSLASLVVEVLAPLKPPFPRDFYGPRRIAVSTNVDLMVLGRQTNERGPRTNAPQQALAGFLKKHQATAEQLVLEGDFWILNKFIPAISTRELILDNLPKALKRLAWPKSMRWGQSGDFTWVRPLRRVVCLFDGETVPIVLGPITASNETEGHRFLNPGAFTVSSASDWEQKLRKRHVIVDQAERQITIGEHLAKQTKKHGLDWVQDYQLIDEVTGLVEWPVVLIGKIGAEFMDLPSEVRELSMKVNQRYFALRKGTEPAPNFAFVSNTETTDGGATIIAGNERVLRARLSDARHFWDLDLKVPLSHYLEKLQNVTFHAKLGTQLDRANRIASLAGDIAVQLGASVEEATLATNAGALAKADLATGMVGEFPELQGIIGGYYAAKYLDRWDGQIVSDAIRTHYQPKGPNDAVPTGIVPCAVALADKIDTLIGFFGVGEEVTGSRDPYALRRTALGIIRIIRENSLQLELLPLFLSSTNLYARQNIILDADSIERKTLFFIADRLRVQLKDEGSRDDLVKAVFALGEDDDLNFLVQRTEALSKLLDSNTGRDLLSAYKRAANILPKGINTLGSPNPNKFSQEEETIVFDKIEEINNKLPLWLGENRQIENAMAAFATLRAPVDAFFDKVTVNDPDPELRRNRLQLLAKLRDTMHLIADFSKIEG